RSRRGDGGPGWGLRPQPRAVRYLRAIMRDLTSLVAALSLSACYTYLPLKTPDPRPGMRVLADITDSGSTRLGEYLGREAAAVEGRVVTVSDTAISLAVNSVRARDGQQSFWKGESVSLRLPPRVRDTRDRKSTRLNSSHRTIS